MAVTQQYLLGELLLRLDRLRAAAPCPAAAAQIVQLRREAETTQVGQLARVTVRALRVADSWCWGSLTSGDMAAFDRQAGATAALYEFGVCSGLIRDQGTD